VSRIKATIVIGTARSGSHMTCDMLYNASTISGKINLGEVTVLPDVDNRYAYCSIVQHQVKNMIAVDTSWIYDYEIVNLRRRDKVAQYISWCVFRAQTQSAINKHSPDWNDYKDLLPWESTREDIELFILEQNLDFAIPANCVVYYEDMIKLGLHTRYKKNTYPVPPEHIVTNYALVKNMLEKYSYHGR